MSRAASHHADGSELDEFSAYPYAHTQGGEVEFVENSLRAIRAELQPHSNTNNITDSNDNNDNNEENNTYSSLHEDSARTGNNNNNNNILTHRKIGHAAQREREREREESERERESLSLHVPKRIKTTSVRQRKRIGKHLSFRERPDWVKSRYFLFTLPYALFFLIGAGLGYSRKRNLYCLFISGAIGLLFLGFGVVHAIDYYSGAPLESIYVALPFVISIFLCILMACFYAIGSVFKTSLLISIVCGVATCVYAYALLKDYSDGTYYRENIYVQSEDKEDLASLLGKPSDSESRDVFSNADELALQGNGPAAAAVPLASPNVAKTDSSGAAHNRREHSDSRIPSQGNESVATFRGNARSSRAQEVMQKGIKIREVIK